MIECSNEVIVQFRATLESTCYVFRPRHETQQLVPLEAGVREAALPSDGLVIVVTRSGRGAVYCREHTAAGANTTFCRHADFDPQLCTGHSDKLEAAVLKVAERVASERRGKTSE